MKLLKKLTNLMSEMEFFSFIRQLLNFLSKADGFEFIFDIFRYPFDILSDRAINSVLSFVMGAPKISW